MKYISMKIEPNGRMPVAAMITPGWVYHGPKGIGLAMLLTRQGKSPFPAQWRPNMVPITVKGKETKSQMANI